MKLIIHFNSTKQRKIVHKKEGKKYKGSRANVDLWRSKICYSIN